MQLLWDLDKVFSVCISVHCFMERTPYENRANMLHEQFMDNQGVGFPSHISESLLRDFHLLYFLIARKDELSFVIAVSFWLKTQGLPSSIVFCSLLNSLSVMGLPFGHIHEFSASSMESLCLIRLGTFFIIPMRPPDLHSELSAYH